MNPRALLSAQYRAGTAIYTNHWSPAGHALIASFMAEYLAATFAAETH